MRERKRVFAFPYAGGSANVYYDLKKELDSEDVELIPIEYSGHGRRYRKTLYDSIQDIAKDVLESMDAYGYYGEYSILGYSMGCLVAIEVYLLLIEQKKRLPQNIFLCASSFNRDTTENKGAIRKMNSEELTDKLKEYGGTPSEILENKEILEFFLPQIRADFISCNEYDYEDTRFADGIRSKGIVLFGVEEFDTSDKITGWNRIFAEECNYHKFKGGHFFIHESYKEINEILVEYI